MPCSNNWGTVKGEKTKTTNRCSRGYALVTNNNKYPTQSKLQIKCDGTKYKCVKDMCKPLYIDNTKYEFTPLYGKKFKDPATVIECSDGYFFEHSNSKSGKIVCDYGDVRPYQKNDNKWFKNQNNMGWYIKDDVHDELCKGLTGPKTCSKGIKVCHVNLSDSKSSSNKCEQYNSNKATYIHSLNEKDAEQCKGDPQCYVKHVKCNYYSGKNLVPECRFREKVGNQICKPSKCDPKNVPNSNRDRIPLPGKGKCIDKDGKQALNSFNEPIKNVHDCNCFKLNTCRKCNDDSRCSWCDSGDRKGCYSKNTGYKELCKSGDGKSGWKKFIGKGQCIYTLPKQVESLKGTDDKPINNETDCNRQPHKCYHNKEKHTASDLDNRVTLTRFLNDKYGSSFVNNIQKVDVNLKGVTTYPRYDDIPKGKYNLDKLCSNIRIHRYTEGNGKDDSEIAGIYLNKKNISCKVSDWGQLGIILKRKNTPDDQLKRLRDALVVDNTIKNINIYNFTPIGNEPHNTKKNFNTARKKLIPVGKLKIGIDSGTQKIKYREPGEGDAYYVFFDDLVDSLDIKKLTNSNNCTKWKEGISIEYLSFIYNRDLNNKKKLKSINKKIQPIISRLDIGKQGKKILDSITMELFDNNNIKNSIELIHLILKKNKKNIPLQILRTGLNTVTLGQLDQDIKDLNIINKYLKIVRKEIQTNAITPTFKLSPNILPKIKSGDICNIKLPIGSDPNTDNYSYGFVDKGILFKVNNRYCNGKRNSEISKIIKPEWQDDGYCGRQAPSTPANKEYAWHWGDGKSKLTDDDEPCNSTLFSTCKVSCNSTYGGGGNYICHYNKDGPTEHCKTINAKYKGKSAAGFKGKGDTYKKECTKYHYCNYNPTLDMGKRCNVIKDSDGKPIKGSLNWIGSPCYKFNDESFHHSMNPIPPLNEFFPPFVRILLLSGLLFLVVFFLPDSINPIFNISGLTSWVMGVITKVFTKVMSFIVSPFKYVLTMLGINMGKVPFTGVWEVFIGLIKDIIFFPITIYNYFSFGNRKKRLIEASKGKYISGAT